MRMRKRKKQVKKAKLKTVRRKPLQPGDKVLLDHKYHEHYGREAIVSKPPYERWGSHNRWVYLTRIKFTNDRNVYRFSRRNLKDVIPETKAAHDYYTMITGGLDGILADS